MDIDKLCQIIARLTATEVGPDSIVSLTSLQQGAFSAMVRKAGMRVDGARLKKPFSPRQIAGAGAEVPAEDPVTEQPRQAGLSAAGLPGGGGRIGCDIQSISEFRNGIDTTDLKSCPFLSEHFSMEEISYCENQADAVESLCGLFAAKEAILKTGSWTGNDLPRISHDRTGRPLAEGFDVSISHSVDYAFAVAILLENG